MDCSALLNRPRRLIEVGHGLHKYCVWFNIRWLFLCTRNHCNLPSTLHDANICVTFSGTDGAWGFTNLCCSNHENIPFLHRNLCCSSAIPHGDGNLPNLSICDEKKRFSFRYVVQSGQNNIFTYRFRCEYLIRFRSCCEVIAFVLRVGTPAACRMRPGWKHTRYRGLHFSAWHQLAHQGSVSIKEDQKRSGNRCRSINNIRKRISNGKQRFSRKSDPSTEYDIIRDG